MLSTKIIIFQASGGSYPYLDWLEGLDTKSKAIVLYNVNKLSSGRNIKDVRSLKDGVFEVKINYGPGYRVYFGKKGKQIVVLLMGGDKGTQFKDIEKAKSYWRQYGKET